MAPWEKAGDVARKSKKTGAKKRKKSQAARQSLAAPAPEAPAPPAPEPEPPAPVPEAPAPAAPDQSAPPQTGGYMAGAAGMAAASFASPQAPPREPQAEPRVEPKVEMQAPPGPPLNVLFVQNSPCIRNYKECRALKARGHRVTLAYSHKKLSEMYDLPDAAYDQSIRIAAPRDLWQLAEKYDLVHCHNEPDVWTVAALAGPRPVVHDTHDLVSLRQPDNADIRFMEAVANRGAQGRIYVSDYLLRAAQAEYGVDPATSIVLPNYVGGEMLPTERLSKLSAADGKVHLVYEGGLTSQPGTHRSFLPLFTELASLGFMVHIHPSRHEPVFAAAAAQNPNLHFYAPAAPTELLNQLTRYDFGLVPFVIQPHNRRHLDSALPNKLFEYLAAGLPVIAADLESLREFVQANQVGFLYQSAQDVPAGIKAWQGREVEWRRFTMESSITKLEGLYRRLMEGQAAHAG